MSRYDYSHLSHWAEVQVVLCFRPWRARQTAYYSGPDCLPKAINDAMRQRAEDASLALVVIDDTGPRWADIPTGFDPTPREE